MLSLAVFCGRAALALPGCSIPRAAVPGALQHRHSSFLPSCQQTEDAEVPQIIMFQGDHWLGTVKDAGASLAGPLLVIKKAKDFFICL